MGYSNLIFLKYEICDISETISPIDTKIYTELPSTARSATLFVLY